MRFFGIFSAFLISAILMAAPSHAQSNVSARIGEHGDYSRLVFEWPEKPAYTISKEGARILVRFNKTGALSGAADLSSANVKKIETLSSASEPLQVAVTIPDKSRFRDFVLEGKLIIDVYAPEGQSAKMEEKPAPPATKEVVEAPPVQKPVQDVKTSAVEKEKEVQPEPKVAADFTKLPAGSGPATPAPAVEAIEVEPAAIDDHVVSFTAIFSVGMAVYERSGYLWIILDTPDLPDLPVLSGPHPEKFGKLEPVDIVDGSAYRLDLPAGIHAHGEGGGLTWKIILSQKPGKGKPVLPLADGTNDAVELVWPMKTMRKHLTFNDPVVGDVVDVVTSGSAEQFAGPPHDFVNIQSLESIIGLAFVAKSDNIKTTLNTRQVRVGAPSGLAVSATKNIPAPIEAVTIKNKETKDEDVPEEEIAETHGDDLALTEAPPPVDEHGAEAEESHGEEHHAEEPKAILTTKEIASVADEKPSGNNVYNFPRWEMGGIHALEQNQHLMMMEVSGKAEKDRAEEVITMVKMNLANNRGAEALGLMRVALQKVPELESNTEFQALRGAAFALSGKFDEAIIDFSSDNLKKYDDIKFWRIYTLAGLEDWSQAIEEMPTDVSPLASYPVAVKIPMLLTLAETSLRAGKVPMAQSILKSMQADLPHLSLPYRSAWSYLSGEAQRQAGYPDKAIATWEPLVKDGKDDLFRAKAGLSLTKLQLDEKKLKPEEAVDRLEGLRYAWRGDELETLVSYRLGQVYIDSEKYLKGLTVLRNAQTLSPGTDLAKDVQSYLVKNFRDIFSKDKLKDVSPLEAISLYEEFKDLTPPGPEGDSYVELLAERLVDADLLGRASALLEYHVNNRLKGPRKAEIAIRLAAIRLLDGNPDGALRSLEIAQSVLDGKVVPASIAAPEEGKQEERVAEQGVSEPEKQRQIYLLKARALSMKDKAAEALAILEKMPLDVDVNRLKTDIAWTSGKWEEAAVALNDLITAEDISPRRPLTEYQREIIFNRAIALNLSGNRVALANLRERYNTQMGGTPRGQMFEIVSRPRRPDMIGSRQAIESMISEIDLFQGFLDGYGKMNKADKEKVPAAKKAPPPATDKAAEPDAANDAQ